MLCIRVPAEIVCTGCLLQPPVVDDALVDVPQPRGHEVGRHHVDGVVTPGGEQHPHPHHRHHPHQPGQGPQPPRRVVRDDEGAEDEDHRVAGEDEVAAVDVVTVDGEPEAGHDLDDPVEDLGRGDGVVELLIAVVLAVGRGQDGDDHGDGAVAVQQTHDNTYPPY